MRGYVSFITWKIRTAAVKAKVEAVASAYAYTLKKLIL
jgi:hypothetical protein